MDEQKIRDAIESFKQEIIDINETFSGGKINTLPVLEVRETAIKALEKQLPKVPEDKVFCEDVWTGELYRDVHTGKCPCCNRKVSDSMFICKCGQKLDWSE